MPHRHKVTSRAAVGGLVIKLCPTLAAPWTVACQAPLSMGFSRQEYWSGLPFYSPGHLPNPWIKPGSPALQANSLPTELQGKPRAVGIFVLYQSPKEEGRGQAKWVEKQKKSFLVPLPSHPFLPTRRLPFMPHGSGTDRTAAHFSRETWGNEFLEKGCRNSHRRREQMYGPKAGQRGLEWIEGWRLTSICYWCTLYKIGN